MNQFDDTKPDYRRETTEKIEDWEILARQAGWMPPTEKKWSAWQVHANRPGGEISAWTREHCDQLYEQHFKPWNETVLGRPAPRNVEEIFENDDRSGSNIITRKYR